LGSIKVLQRVPESIPRNSARLQRLAESIPGLLYKFGLRNNQKEVTYTRGTRHATSAYAGVLKIDTRGASKIKLKMPVKRKQFQLEGNFFNENFSRHPSLI
jgi:hypothetical protein